MLVPEGLPGPEGPCAVALWGLRLPGKVATDGLKTSCAGLRVPCVVACLCVGLQAPDPFAACKHIGSSVLACCLRLNGKAANMEKLDRQTVACASRKLRSCFDWKQQNQQCLAGTVQSETLLRPAAVLQ